MKKSLLIAAFAGTILAASLGAVAPSMAQQGGCTTSQTGGDSRNPKPCPEQQIEQPQRGDWRRQPPQQDWRAQDQLRRQQEEARRQEEWRRQQDAARQQQDAARRQDEWRRQQEEARRQEEWRRRRDQPSIVIAPPVYVQPPVVYDPQPGYGGGGRWVPCARENGICDVPYSTRVRFGRGGRYAYQDVDGPIRCSNSNFGDPARGSRKRCDYLAD